MSRIGQIQDVDLKLLRCFCTIVEEGSLTAAQVALRLSQSSLSEYLKTLELRLGVTLCQRGPKGFKLYEEGREVYLAARELFASIDAFKHSVTNVSAGYRGELVLGVEDSIIENPDCHIPEAIERFSNVASGIRIRVEIMLGAQLIGRVADGLFPIGVGLENLSFSQLDSSHLFEEHLYLYCGRNHPLFEVPDDRITAEQIASFPYCSRGHLEAAHPERVDNSIPFSGDIGLGGQAQLALILSGRDLGYLPVHIASSYVAAGRLRSVRSDLIHRIRTVAAMTGPRAAKNKVLRHFIRILAEAHAQTRANLSLRRPTAQSIVPTTALGGVLAND